MKAVRPVERQARSTPAAPAAPAQQRPASWPAWAGATAPTQVSHPRDADEREAERTADAAMNEASALPGVNARATTAQATAQATAQTTAPTRSTPAAARPPGPGEPLPEATRVLFEARLGHDFSGVRIHRDAAAGAAAQGLGAKAFALGHDIAFAPGQFDPASHAGQRLLAHELAHVAQTGGQATHVHRHAVAPTDIVRKPRLAVLGDGTPAHLGMTLTEFEQYTRAQADWFVEPSLKVADRDVLWPLLIHASTVAPTLAGIGDVHLADLRAVAAADWPALDAFCRACHGASQTISIATATAYATLAERINVGTTLIGLEALMPADVLELTVTEKQLRDITTHGWLPLIANYWVQFQPQVEGSHTVTGGVSEFQKLLDLVTSVAGIAPFMALLGNIRNLHRFSVKLLARLVLNFADVSRARPVHLVIHTGHDAGAFQQSAGLFEDLVLTSPNLVLMLEGQASLAAITARVPGLAAAYGQKDKGGTFRIAQVMIAGHGSARSVELAGTGNRGHAGYVSESLDLDANLKPTTDLLDALMNNMDPATARLVYAGCLVGANPVPVGTAPAAMLGHIAATPSLGTFTEKRGAARGLKPGFVMAARASVGLSAATSLHDASGNMTMTYAFDQAAFGSSLGYVPVGHEPEGVMVAAVEVAATYGPVVAEMLLRARLGAPGVDPWWDECTLVMVALALDGVAPFAGIDIARVNAIAHTAEIPFLSAFPAKYKLKVAHYIGRVNPQPFANDLYTRLLATPTFTAVVADADLHAGRLIIEQGWLAFGGARAAPLIAFLDATPALTPDLIEPLLDTVVTGPHSALLFPPAAAPTAGRLRLAMTWLRKDPANADVRAFLDSQVLMPAAGPELTPAARAQLGGTPEHEVLKALGRLAAVAAAAGGKPALPKANADLIRSGRKKNDILVEPQAYEATVLTPTLPVLYQPHMLSASFARLKAGDRIRVMGFTHAWAAFDRGGKLAFVDRTKITLPP